MPRLLNILNRLLQILQLLPNLLLRLLSTLDRLPLKRLNPLQHSRDIIRHGLETPCRLFNLINDLCVLEDAVVVGKVDFCLGGFEVVEFVVGVDVAFAEGGQGRCRCGGQGEGSGELGPVDAGDGAAGGHRSDGWARSTANWQWMGSAMERAEGGRRRRTVM
jgi:hypothetical protein